ncbi:unnamed protein product [Symbiodinium sp. CCMP2592]|nr:unnamed protein product [Symbiodinium sp. CCMP2592]
MAGNGSMQFGFGYFCRRQFVTCVAPKERRRMLISQEQMQERLNSGQHHCKVKLLAQRQADEAERRRSADQSFLLLEVGRGLSSRLDFNIILLLMPEERSGCALGKVFPSASCASTCRRSPGLLLRRWMPRKPCHGVSLAWRAARCMSSLQQATGLRLAWHGSSALKDANAALSRAPSAAVDAPQARACRAMSRCISCLESGPMHVAFARRGSGRSRRGELQATNGWQLLVIANSSCCSPAVSGNQADRVPSFVIHCGVLPIHSLALVVAVIARELWDCAVAGAVAGSGCFWIPWPMLGGLRPQCLVFDQTNAAECPSDGSGLRRSGAFVEFGGPRGELACTAAAAEDCLQRHAAPYFSEACHRNLHPRACRRMCPPHCLRAADSGSKARRYEWALDKRILPARAMAMAPIPCVVTGKPCQPLSESKEWNKGLTKYEQSAAADYKKFSRAVGGPGGVYAPFMNNRTAVNTFHLMNYFNKIVVRQQLGKGLTACYRSASGRLRKLDDTDRSLESFRSDALKLCRNSSVLNFHIMLRRDNTRLTLWAPGQGQLLSRPVSPEELTMTFIGEWQTDENIGSVQYFKNLVGYSVPLSEASMLEFKQVSFESSSSDLDIEFQLFCPSGRLFVDYAQPLAENNADWSGSNVLDYTVILTI